MTQEEHKSAMKKIIRQAGVYALSTILLTFVWAATAPNGQDSGWHSFAGTVILILWFAPFLGFILLWLFCEFKKWPVEVVDKNDAV